MNKVLPYTLYRISSFFYKEKKHLYYPNNYAKRITILGGAICERYGCEKRKGNQSKAILANSYPNEQRDMTVTPTGIDSFKVWAETLHQRATNHEFSD
ncbi:uncharacterized protein LOC143253738 isoform X2 [Tachypleus tridentatus]|uniref:uncharacterized protein LOC143253738 isoform X2 n=1 Tax=Tachypleus tridentatus TaxID=6853 RepID=UPI003FD5421E